MLLLLICNPPSVRAWEFIISVTMIVAGIWLFSRARRGKVVGFVAAIGQERVLWTKIVAVVLFLIGAMILLSATFGLDC